MPPCALIPTHWWIIVWVVFIGFTVLLAQLAPVVLFPIFYRFEPLKNDGFGNVWCGSAKAPARGFAACTSGRSQRSRRKRMPR